MLKRVVDILGIALPAAIILLGLLRLFSPKKASTYNGLIMFIAIILLLTGAIRYLFFSGSGSNNSEPKPVPLTVSKHSDTFNQSVQTMLNAYYQMTEAFVNWDTAGINKYGTDLKTALDSFKADELQKDSAIYITVLDPLSNARIEAESILKDPSIAEKRGSLNLLSDNIRSLLVIVKYDQAKLYWQECPMAFGEERPGNWLSKTVDVRNPYLGIKDPKYGSDMLECGGPKDTINFMIADTTKKAN